MLNVSSVKKLNDLKLQAQVALRVWLELGRVVSLVGRMSHLSFQSLYKL